MSFEYMVLAGSAGLFVLVLLGVGLAALARAFGRGGGGISLPAMPTGRKPSRAFLDSMAELMREAAASELEKAFADPANNPHIPSFLAKAPAKAPEAEAPKAP